MSLQNSFVFEAALPEPVLPAQKIVRVSRRLPNDRRQLEEEIQAVVPELPDEVCASDVFVATGYSPLSATAWHCARVIELLTLTAEDGSPGPFISFLVPAGGVRFRRRPPAEPSPGYDQPGCCGTPVIGGGLCARCLKDEEYDLWNQP